MIVINQNCYQPMREARIEQGLTQRELGQRTGIPYYTIQAYERGRHNPPAKRLRTLAEVLGLEVEDYPLPPMRTTASERNQLLEKYMDLPGYIIRQNWTLVLATGLDVEDVRQELLLRGLQAIETYDPSAGASLRTHLNIAMQYHLMKLARKASSRGMTDVPRGVRVTFCSVEAMCEYGFELEG
ncbi:helix-turn-helix domain-containing protein [Acutalibacter muris]|uniref:Helix-turn-helix domain-containing protein n=1 Tax=Acutalibacter muris TaxID=1796620 RepID=A0A1Z2XPD8_9FIRM|nr:helix-turn-helix domain-containing protein [Acutalibacter muris]ANU53024.1 hypothetical protein A4V00_02735 [Hungateiclostridiaceae bacterium KB18]ASB40300.1 hypothetical protein ADH66_06280 [Acutalibacter muris]QQR29592.1 helix-turn-helix domain-containing protein [Acutalibacter muris]